MFSIAIDLVQYILKQVSVLTYQDGPNKIRYQ